MEVLVAVVLMTVVFTAAFLLLDHTRRVSDQLVTKRSGKTPSSDFEAFAMMVRQDLDHAIVPVREEERPGFLLQQHPTGSRVEWMSLDTANLPVRCAYQFSEQESALFRAEASLHQNAYLTWQTNRVLSGIAEIEIQVHDGTAWRRSWPPVASSKESLLPNLLQFRVLLEGEPDHRIVDALLPLSLEAGE